MTVDTPAMSEKINEVLVNYATSYLVNLSTHPVRTKAYTSGVLNALGEIIASAVTGDVDPRTGTIISSRVPNMALYGFFISGPLSHYLYELLQKAFEGRTSSKDKLLQILVANLTATPIQNTVFLVFMAIFAGARTKEQVIKSVKAMWLPVMKSSWITSPIVLAIAQRYIPKMAWTPFFSVLAFFLATYNNIRVKRRRLAAQKDKKSE